jgi:uncharacterized zinc-type alcohol dehydrogenase-like protein
MLSPPRRHRAALTPGATFDGSTSEPAIRLIGRTPLANNPNDTFGPVPGGRHSAGGVFVTVGFPGEPYQLHAASLLARRQSIVGSNVGGLALTQDMPDFCAEHGIAAEIEPIGADRIAEADQRIPSSQVRYRFVIDLAETLTEAVG